MSRISQFVVSAALTVLSLPSCNLLGEEVDTAGIISSQFVLVTVDAGSLEGGFVMADEVINPERFLPAATEKLGRTPTSVDLLSLKLSAGQGVDGVLDWSNVFTGPLTVSLVPETGAAIDVALVAVPTFGLDTISAKVTTNRDALDQAPDIAAGRFSVALKAVSDRATEPAFTLPVRVELELVAF